MNQKFRLHQLILMFFLTLLTFVTGCRPDNLPPTFVAATNYQVNVQDKYTTKFITNASVTLEKSNGSLSETRLTDTRGNAVFDKISADLLTQVSLIIVEASGYEKFTQYINIETDRLPTVIQLNSLPTPTPKPMPKPPCDLNLNPSISDAPNTLSSGEMIGLTANANSSVDARYSWEADRGEFSAEDKQFTIYTAPVEPGKVILTVTVTDEGCGSSEFSFVEIDILPSQEDEDDSGIVCLELDVEMEADSMEMFVGETAVITINLATDETTSNWDAEKGDINGDDSGEAEYVAPNEPGEYEITAIAENECGEQANASVTVQVNGISPTAVPITTTPPSPIDEGSIPKPIITYLEVLPGGALTVSWQWEKELAPGQSFAVRFWPQADPRPEARFSITWTEQFTYQFSVDNETYPPGQYYINVAVMNGSSDGVHSEYVVSEDMLIPVSAPPPTKPPTCPPVCT
jgi:hypothetical protein